MTGNEFLETVLDIGSAMISCGAEVYRAEESVERLCRAYSMERVEVFSTPASLIVTLTPPDEEATTQLREIPSRENNLNKLDKLNALVRNICNNPVELQIMRERFEQANDTPLYPLYMQMIGHGMGAGAFAMLNGGHFVDALLAFVVGASLRFTLKKLEGFQTNLLLTNLICSVLGALIGGILGTVIPGAQADKIIIGMLITLVPGAAFTNAIRDFVAQDSLSGVIRLVEALLIGVGIAMGITAVLAVLQPIMGVQI